MKRFVDFIESCKLHGLAKGKTPDDLARKHGVSVKDINKQIQIGITVETEHTKDSTSAKAIAMDHVFEDPNYYTKLKKMEANEEMNNTTQGLPGISPGEPTVVNRKGKGLLFRRRIRRKR